MSVAAARSLVFSRLFLCAEAASDQARSGIFVVVEFVGVRESATGAGLLAKSTTGYRGGLLAKSTAGYRGGLLGKFTAGYSTGIPRTILKDE